jgi:hypothetical protein
MRKQMRVGCVTCAAAFVCLVSITRIAHAGFTPPTGVASYRLAFEALPFIEATSTDISTYNAYAASQVGQPFSSLPTTWRAIGSTASVSAAQNISCGAICDATVPIYLLDGTTEVATSTDAMFAGEILTPIGIAGPQNGDYPIAWTGSNSDGSAAVGHELGTAQPEIGAPASASTAMIDSGAAPGNYYGLGLYVISGELLNPTSVPEPTSLCLFGLGGIAAALINAVRRARRARGCYTSPAT